MDSFCVDCWDAGELCTQIRKMWACVLWRSWRDFGQSILSEWLKEMKVRILCWTLLIKYFNVTSRRQARPSHPLYLRSQFLWMKQLPILFFKLQLTHYQTFLSTKNGPFTEGYSFDGRWYFGRKQHLGLRNLGESWRSSCLFMSEGRQEKGRLQPHLQQRQKMLILRC